MLISMPLMHIKKPGEMASVGNTLLKQIDTENRAEVVALYGDLGAGKTTLVQMLAKSLGVTEEVTSPTFVIMKSYDTVGPYNIDQLVHIDAYRIEEASEMEVLGFRELLETPGVLVCIEWAEHIKSLLPKNVIEVSISISDNDGGRDVEVRGY